LQIFGQDWQRNQFGIKAAGPSTVLLLQIGSGQAFGIADTLQQAHEVEFAEFADEALSIRLWQEWLASGGAIPGFKPVRGKPLTYRNLSEVYYYPGISLIPLRRGWGYSSC
jgi:hypothetical protein